MILLVDDEMDLLVLLKSKLTRQGYEVETSLNGEHLLDNVMRLQPDLILMDVTMRGLDGGSLCQLLKTSDCTNRIPIVLFSGNANIRAIGLDCQADGVLNKPYDPVAFQQVLDKFVA